MIEPRQYQADALVRVDSEFKTHNSVALVMPTGSGKGSTASIKLMNEVAAGRRCLAVAHRQELVIDLARRLAGCGAQVGVVASGRDELVDPLAPIQVCSHQTLMARGERPPAEFLFVDEAHHDTAPTHRELRAAYASAKVLGATATPERSDGTALGNAFESMVVGPSIRELQAIGALARCDVVGPTKRREKLAMDPAAALAKYSAGRSAIVFCRSVAHAHEVAKTTGGVCIEGKTGDIVRRDALDAFVAGEIKVLTNVFVLTEGTDLPIAKVIVLARSVGSAAMLLQTAGRGLRPYEDQTALLIDLMGSVWQHGLPDDDRIFSLTGQAIRDGAERLPSLTRCKACFALYRGRNPCPRCGAPPPAAPKPKLSQEELAKISATIPRAEKQKLFDSLISYARRTGRSDEYAGYIFKAKMGFWPNGYRYHDHKFQA